LWGGFVIVKALVVGPIQANCYIVGCEQTQQAVVIDPGDEARHIFTVLRDSGLEARYIINTHGHFDHVGANKELKDLTGALIAIHSADAPMLGHISRVAASWGLHIDDSPPADLELKEGDYITAGTLKFRVLHTPGHSPGGISLLLDDVVFVGDTLFMGSIGRTDFPGGDHQTLIDSVQKKLFSLGDHVHVLSGHGPATTIGREKQTNPFFQGR
jgi:hydroxyacylglutathione hydrolase